MLSTSLVEHAVRKELSCRFRNPIFNTAVESIDKSDSLQELARYTSTNGLLTSSVGKGDSRITFARRRAALYVLVGVIGAMIAVDSARNKKFYQLVTAVGIFREIMNLRTRLGITVLKF